MNQIIFTLCIAGMLVLIISLFIDMPYASNLAIILWSIPAGAAASSARRKELY